MNVPNWLNALVGFAATMSQHFYMAIIAVFVWVLSMVLASVNPLAGTVWTVAAFYIGAMVGVILWKRG